MVSLNDLYRNMNYVINTMTAIVV